MPCRSTARLFSSRLKTKPSTGSLLTERPPQLKELSLCFVQIIALMETSSNLRRDFALSQQGSSILKSRKNPASNLLLLTERSVSAEGNFIHTAMSTCLHVHMTAYTSLIKKLLFLLFNLVGESLPPGRNPPEDPHGGFLRFTPHPFLAGTPRNAPYYFAAS